MLRVTVVKLGRINIFPATPRVLNAPVDLSTKPKVPRHATQCLPVPTVGMALYDHVKQVTIVKVEPPIKPLVYPGLTPPKQDPLPVLNAHPEHMPILMVPRHVRIVTTIPTNRHLMRRHAFQ